jgi:hypothetical protein
MINHGCRKCAQESKVYEGLCAYRGQKIVKKFTHLLDDAVIKIKKINEENIPQHNSSVGLVSLM